MKKLTTMLAVLLAGCASTPGPVTEADDVDRCEALCLQERSACLHGDNGNWQWCEDNTDDCLQQCR